MHRVDYFDWPLTVLQNNVFRQGSSRCTVTSVHNGPYIRVDDVTLDRNHLISLELYCYNKSSAAVYSFGTCSTLRYHYYVRNSLTWKFRIVMNKLRKTLLSWPARRLSRPSKIVNDLVDLNQVTQTAFFIFRRFKTLVKNSDFGRHFKTIYFMQIL